jgi:type I restriction-modification system DNA methylase subunit
MESSAAPGPERVQELVSYFREHRSALRKASYSEALVRQELINPFFEALGWDVNNRTLRLPPDRDVIHEPPLRIGGTRKAPDYCFLAGRRRRFFVEAKKPSVNVARDRSAAYQIRRYCWNAGLPFGIVTDFDEFAVYDCRYQPDPLDSPSVGRTQYFTFEEYEANWDWLRQTFGRDAVAAGSLDRLAVGQPALRTQQSFKESFLKEIRQWRQRLAADIASRNAALTAAELKAVVQMLINRIVFLRSAEARHLEPDDELDRTRRDGQGIYPRLFQLFQRADDRYNSGLFHFQRERRRNTPPDKLAADLIVGDTVLNNVLARLYYSYELSVVSVDVLGQVYEQFLGEVITLKPNRKVTVKIKPEVRKSGGIYYTPQPIVEYIVRQTLQPLLVGRSVTQAEKIRLVDPACGSGSFLIAAYHYLLDWHLEQYLSRPRSVGLIEQGPDGQPRLTMNARRRILLNNIFGVDVDPQAVEVAKLSLLLKLIEDQQQQYELEVGRLLPDLDNNILCGNSIIAPDYAPEGKGDLGSEPPNLFDWEAGFPKVFAQGGFDAVIGNPPYYSVDAVWGQGDPRLGYLRRAYSDVYADKTNVLFYFFKRGVDICQGELSFIVSRSFLESAKARRLRAWLPKNMRIREILDFQRAQVFTGVGINTAIVRLTRSRRTGPAKVRRFVPRSLPPRYTAETLDEAGLFKTLDVEQARFTGDSWLFADASCQKVLAKIDSRGTIIGDILKVGQGMQTGRNDVFEGLLPSMPPKDSELAPFFFIRARNSDIQRYRIEPYGPPLIYPELVTDFEDLPKLIRTHLCAHEKELKRRAAYRRGNCAWWKCTWPRHADYVDRARIFTPYQASGNRFALDSECRFLGVTDTTVLYVAGQPEDLRFILGVLNSRVLEFRFRFIGKLKGGGVYEYYKNTVRRLPIPRSQPGTVQHDRLVELVDTRIALAEELGGQPAAYDRGLIQSDIAAVERAIDEHVYGLFDLDDDDQAVIDSVLGPVETSLPS